MEPEFNVDKCISKQIKREIADAVKVERELIRMAFQRQKPKRKHHGRMVLPSHLPVEETVIEPSKDTTNMVYYRIFKQIVRMGVPLASSTLESWVKLGGKLLQPLYAVHRLYVFGEIYQMIDESPIKVQAKDKLGACHQGNKWVRYATLSKSALSEYYRSRSTKGPTDDLTSFNGYLQTDGYTG